MDTNTRYYYQARIFGKTRKTAFGLPCATPELAAIMDGHLRLHVGERVAIYRIDTEGEHPDVIVSVGPFREMSGLDQLSTSTYERLASSRPAAPAGPDASPVAPEPGE